MRSLFQLSIIILLTLALTGTVLGDWGPEIRIDQAWVLQNINQDGNVVLEDWNQNDWPSEEYGSPDYLIMSDLIFGTQQGQANANLVIQPGTRIWFHLGLDGQGHVNDVYNIIMANGKTITCGGVGEFDQTVIEPNPIDWPQTIQGECFDDFHDSYPEGAFEDEAPLIFAGGFILGSSGNVFTNTLIRRLIGTDLTLDVNGQTLHWYNDETDPITNRLFQTCYAIKLIGNGSGVTLDGGSIMTESFDNAILNEGDGSTITLDEAIISNTLSLVPSAIDFQNQLYTPDLIEPWIGTAIYCLDVEHSVSINVAGSNIVDNKGIGIWVECSTSSVSVSTSHIDRNYYGAILWSTAGQDLWDIQDGSTFNENMNQGIEIYSMFSSGTVVNIGTDEGSCEVNSNMGGGILFAGVGSSLSLANGTTVNSNVSWHGIVATGSDLLISFVNDTQVNFNHENGVSLENVSTSTMNVEDQCIFNENGSNGIRLKAIRSLMMSVEDQCLFNENGGSGLYGWDAWDVVLTVSSFCEFNTNAKCGILFDCGGLRVPYVGVGYQENPVNPFADEDHRFCADCKVTLSDHCQVNDNQGPVVQNGRDAGIAMYGMGHYLKVAQNSIVSGNCSDGIRMDCYDMAQCIVNTYSEISHNAGRGVWIYKPYNTKIDRAVVYWNDGDGIFLERYWDPRISLPAWGWPESPWEPLPSTNGMQAAITNINSTEPLAHTIEGNGGDGIRIVGGANGDVFLEVLIQKCDITQSMGITNNPIYDFGTGDGIQLANLRDDNDDTNLPIRVDECQVFGNACNGIDIRGDFAFGAVEINGTKSRNNLENGLLVHETLFERHVIGESVIPSIKVCNTLLKPSGFSGNDSSGIKIENYDEMLVFQMEYADTIRDNGRDGIFIGNPDEQLDGWWEMGGGGLTMNLKGVWFGGNDHSIYLADTYDEVSPQEPFPPLSASNINIYGCWFNDPYGIWSNTHVASHFWIAPAQPDPNPESGAQTSEISYFNCIEGIHIDAAPPAPNDENWTWSATTLLVDKVKFNAEWNEATPIEQVPATHCINISGQLKGGFWNELQLGFFVEDYSSIRRSWFGVTRRGIALTSTGVDDPPSIQIHNNYFTDNWVAAVDVNYTASTGDTKIYNNTFIDDQQPACGTAILLEPQGNSPLDDGTIYNNLIERFTNGVSRLNAGGGFTVRNQLTHNTATPVQNCAELDCRAPQDPTPLFVSLDDEHVYWNSECINNGLGDDILYLPSPDAPGYFRKTSADNAANDAADIGCTGGDTYAGILDHDPYTILPSTIASGNPVTLQPDEYSFNGSIMNVNDRFQVPAYTDILLGPSQEIKINGQGANNNGFIEADGLVGNAKTIHFYPKVSNIRWSRIYVYYPQDDCLFRGCDIWNADRNIYAYGGVPNPPAPTEPINILDCRLTEGHTNNLYVYGYAAMDCQRTEFSHSEGDGVNLSYNNAYSSFIGCEFKYNGSLSGNAGLYCNANAPRVFQSNEIAYNYSRGLYLTSAAFVFDGERDVANSVHGNGPSNQSNATGAEFYLTSAANPRVWMVNIGDVRGDPRDRVGKFVYKSGAGAVDFRHNFWGDALHGGCQVDGKIEFDDLTEAQRLSYFTGSVDYGEAAAEWEDDFIAGAGWEVGVDNANEDAQFENALSLMADADYNEAISAFWDYIGDGSSKMTINSLYRILWSTINGNGNLESLKNNYNQFLSENAELEPETRFIAQRLTGFCTLNQGRTAEAIEELEALRGGAPSYEDSLSLEMDIVFAESVMNGNQINAAEDANRELNRLREMLDEPQESSDELSGLPTQFRIASLYPNPFNSRITIEYQLPKSGKVRLSVFDLSGREIAVLADKQMTAGSHRIAWSAEGSPSGVYFCRMAGPGFSQTAKMVLAR